MNSENPSTSLIKILLIEDVETDYILTNELLLEIYTTHYKLDWIKTFEDGLKEVSKQRHDIYLLDYKLGINTGVDLLQQAINYGCKKPMIIFTGLENRDIDQLAMETGAYDYLVKNNLNADMLERSIRYARNSYFQKLKINKSEKKYRNLVETSQDLIWICDTEGRITYLNPTWEKVVGYKINEMIGRVFSEFQLVEEVEKNFNEFESHLDGESVSEYPSIYISKTGKKKYLVFNAIPLKNDKDVIIGTQGTAYDITDKIKLERESKIIENALKESENKYRNLIETSNNIIWRVDANNIMLYINPVVETILGYKPEEIIGKKFTYFISSEQASIKAKKLFQTIIQGEPIENYEFTLKTKFGEERTVNLSAFSLKDEDDKINGVQGTFIDITEKKKAEKELANTRDQLFQAQKMEALGEIAGNIAHEFNNLLTLITFKAESLLINSTTNDDHITNIESILDTVQVAVKLTTELLTFSRPGLKKPKLININDIFKKYFTTLGHFIRKDIETQFNLEEQIGEIYFDPNHFEQVILNLILNSVDAMPKGGVLKIYSKNIPKNHIQFHGKYNTKPFLEVSIIDTGVGMDKKTQSRMFEPFYTTKEEGKGTGLGLSIVYSMIQYNNGFIKVKSKLGEGTKISIYLPIRNIPDYQSEDKINEKLGNGEKILLIDDDDNIRKIIKGILIVNGYDIIDVGDPYEAIRLFKENQDEIDVIICDLILPHLSGSELIKQFLLIKPSIQVLFISGYKNELQKLSDSLSSNMDIMHKPFDTDALVQKIKMLIDKNS